MKIKDIYLARVSLHNSKELEPGSVFRIRSP